MVGWKRLRCRRRRRHRAVLKIRRVLFGNIQYTLTYINASGKITLFRIFHTGMHLEDGWRTRESLDGFTPDMCRYVSYFGDDEEHRHRCQSPSYRTKRPALIDLLKSSCYVRKFPTSHVRSLLYFLPIHACRTAPLQTGKNFLPGSLIKFANSFFFLHLQVLLCIMQRRYK